MKMSNLTRDKKGSDRIVSVYWFAILFIVAAAIVYLVVSFYGKPYDVRGVEANVLTSRVADCFSKGGYLVESSLQFNSENFLEKCDLIFQTENDYDWNTLKQYYVEVSVTDFNSGGEIIPSIDVGNINLKDSCGKEGENLPVCVRRSFYSVDRENNQYKVNIIAVVRKTEKNV